MKRKLAEAKAGASLGADSSMLKYYGTELNKRKHELMMDATGHEGLEWESERSNDGKMARSWLRAIIATKPDLIAPSGPKWPRKALRVS